MASAIAKQTFLTLLKSSKSAASSVKKIGTNIGKIGIANKNGIFSIGTEVGVATAFYLNTTDSNFADDIKLLGFTTDLAISIALTATGVGAIVDIMLASVQIGGQFLDVLIDQETSKANPAFALNITSNEQAFSFIENLYRLREQLYEYNENMFVVVPKLVSWDLEKDELVLDEDGLRYSNYIKEYYKSKGIITINEVSDLFKEYTLKQIDDKIKEINRLSFIQELKLNQLGEINSASVVKNISVNYTNRLQERKKQLIQKWESQLNEDITDDDSGVYAVISAGLVSMLLVGFFSSTLSILI